jgi:molybdopterin/thiamine biosynthesis adenylyltransferase
MAVLSWLRLRGPLPWAMREEVRCRMEPMLKEVAWSRWGDELRVVFDVREPILVLDPDGSVERLLGLLCEGGRTIPVIAAELGRSPEDVATVVELLDRLRLVEDGQRLGGLSREEQRRHGSNLAFFERYASLATSREDLYHRTRDGRVLVLGTGGLNANVILALCGLGVGRLILLDHGRVEAGHLARQSLYRWEDIGSSKAFRAAAWVRRFDPSIEVAAIDGTVSSPSYVLDVLAEHRPDVVVSGVDSPGEVGRWVNEACVAAGVPYVCGALWDRHGRIWSVMPRRSACRECVTVKAENQEVRFDAEIVDSSAALGPYGQPAGVNRAIGPVTAVLGALAAIEVLRYLTRFEEPVYAGRPVYVDFAPSCALSSVHWVRRSDCRVCGSPLTEGLNTDDRRGAPRLASTDS